MGPSDESLALLLEFLRDLRSHAVRVEGAHALADFERVRLDFTVEDVTVRLDYAPFAHPDVVHLSTQLASMPDVLPLDGLTPDALAHAMTLAAARHSRSARAHEPTLP